MKRGEGARRNQIRKEREQPTTLFMRISLKKSSSSHFSHANHFPRYAALLQTHLKVAFPEHLSLRGHHIPHIGPAFANYVSCFCFSKLGQGLGERSKSRNIRKINGQRRFK